MIKTTLPFIINALKKNAIWIVFIVILSVFLGLIPTLKSEIEAGVIDTAVSGKISDIPEDASISHKIYAGLSARTDRYDAADPNSDIPESLARFILQGINNLMMLTICYLLVSAVFYIIQYFSDKMKNAIRRDIYFDIRGAGLRRAFKTGHSISGYTGPNQSGFTSASIQIGAENVSNTYAFIVEAFAYVFSFVVALIAIATKNWQLSLLCLLVVALQALISLLQARKLEQDRKVYDKNRNELLGSTDEIISNREMLLAYEQFGPYAKKVDTLSGKFSELERTLDNRESFYRQLVSLCEDYGRLFVLAGALIIFLIFPDENSRDTADIYFLISIYVRMLVPAINLLNRYDQVRRAGATSAVFLEILRSKEEDSKGLEWTKDIDIDVMNLTHRFDGAKKDSLSELSFKIPSGETTLLIGPSGCGKTTIARILLGFCRKTAGEIQIGGHEIDDFDGETLRLAMSYVPQRDDVIDETIYENLAWARGAKSVSLEEMIDVLQQVGLDDVVMRDPELCTRCVELSGGQRQRISVARMMLDDAEIVILDEPISGVDALTMKDLMPKLEYILRQKGQTVLLISHRLFLSDLADNVIILNESGSLEELGTVEELKSKDSLFASLREITRSEV